MANLPLPVVGPDGDHSDFKEADSVFGHVPNMRSRRRLFQSEYGAGLQRASGARNSLLDHGAQGHRLQRGADGISERMEMDC
jgi:hypothetical protein